MSAGGVAVVVQARTGSRRLPGKVLLPLAGEPALLRMLQRVERIEDADERVVATSEAPGDDAIAELCRRHGVRCARGSEDDVLARTVAALPPGCDTVVRLTGDCPLVEPALVDLHLRRFAEEQPFAGYVTNTVVRSWPDGMDVEVVDRELLERAAREARTRYDREHVTPWVRRRARTVPVAQEVDLSALRLTLDTRSDYEAIAGIWDALGPGAGFVLRDVYALLLRRPDLLRVRGRERLDDSEREAWLGRLRCQLAAGEAA